MKVQVDIQKVGESSRSGDAIAIFGQDPNINYLIVIDGGTKDSASKLINTIKTHYKVSIVDLLVVTHGDSDHASGAIEILNSIKVNHLACNFPWEFVDNIYPKIDHSGITKDSLEANFRERYPYLDELEKIGIEKEVSIHKAISGLPAFQDRVIYRILGPTEEKFTSEMLTVLQDEVYTHKIAESLLAETQKQELAELTINQPDHISLPDRLTDVGYTTSTNETSVISLLDADSYKILFTGDSGIDSLINALGWAESQQIDATNPEYFQVPHHGSMKCISRQLLNFLRPQKAFVSCASSDPFHPSPTVVNSFHKRKIPIYTTKESSLWLKNFTISRDGYDTADIAPFHSLIERIE
jgi:hypothetical protein